MPPPAPVLLFPPVHSYRRFLIHQCVEEFPGLASLSIGVGCDRRTVVCFKEALLSDVAGAKPNMGLSQTECPSSRDACNGESEHLVKAKSSLDGAVVKERAISAGAAGEVREVGEGGAYRPPAHAHRLKTQQTQEKIRPITSKQRRPDRAVYVPRARRSAENAPLNCTHDIASESRKCLNPPETEELDRSFEPASESREAYQPTSPRKSLDRKYCNVYTPPHLRNKRGNLEPPPIADVYTDPGQVPNIDSAISYSDTSFNDKVFSDNSNLSSEDNIYVRRDSFDSTPNEYCCDLEPDIEGFFINYERNSHFYEDNFANNNLDDKKVRNADGVDEINMAVPNPNNSVDIIENDARIYSNSNKDEDVDQNELRRASQEINRSNRRIIKQSFDSDVLVISEPVDVQKPEETNDDLPSPTVKVTKPKLEAKVSLKREENDWDTVFDDDGECLDPSLLEELTATVGKVQITKPKNNYEPYIDKGAAVVLSGETFGHVVEVYNFPTEFKTNDLLSVFSDYKDTGFEIKWVDDTHALIVFSSAKIAAEVMSLQHPMVRCRALRDATAESRSKAKKCAEFLQPYRQRPETCTALARRLVSGALGVRLSTARQERAEERRLIGIAREKKRQAALHKEAAWDGSLTSEAIDNS